MKTLKFMLAAATAIGLASATQADQYNTTGFEKLTVGDPVTTGVEDNLSGYSYFYYAGATAEDNESVIAAGTPDVARPRGAAAVDAGREKILQVSTGTDPLLRTYEGFTGSSPVAATTLASDVYVDTLVQFTVTPYTDTVTPNEADKLMIYLKESVTTNEFGEITSTSTNLVVVGGYYDALAEGDKFVKEEYVASTTVLPGQWYRLTVKVLANLAEGSPFAAQQKFPAFKVYINNEVCTFDKRTVANNQQTTLSFTGATEMSALTSSQVVLSLLADGTTVASLQAVGFAGEGKVDDIVFGTVDPFATVFDFTFAEFGTGVSSVTYTVGGVEYDQARTFPEVESNTVVTITAIQYATGYGADAITPVGLTAGSGDNTWTVTSAGASLTVTAQEQQQTGWVDDPTTVSNQTAATAYPALAGSALANADAQQLTVWAKANSVAFNDATTTPGDYVEAFLLNCAPVAATVAAEKEAFVLDISVAADGTVTVSLPAGKSYNGTLQLKGSTDLSTWTDISAPSSSYNFYKYELSL